MVDRCEPPAEWRHVRWHWVRSDRRGGEVLEWCQEMWLSAGVAFAADPAELASYGCRYVAPCLPPEGV